MTAPLRILIMNRKYDETIGGVERMSVLLTNEMAERGHECHIVSLDLPGAKMYFSLSDKVMWHRIAQTPADVKASWKERLRRLFAIRGILRKYKIDVAIGFQDGAYLSVMTAGLFTGVKIVAAERNSPARFAFLKNKKLQHTVFNSFRLAAAVTVQCPSYAGKYPDYLRRKITVIPNPIMPASKIADPEGNPKEILFVGRLSFQKNIETLIYAFALLEKDFPGWTLRLVGGGDLENSLALLCDNLNIKDRVVFSGASSAVTKFYERAQIFCLPSLWEGFPNALAEAMAHGLPAVGYAECDGVNDLIHHGATGFLVQGDVKNALNLATQLRVLMSDPDKRRTMGDAAREATKRYTSDEVFRQWEMLFASLKNG